MSFFPKKKNKTKQQEDLQESGQSPSNEERISLKARNGNNWHKKTKPYCMCNINF